MTWETVVSMIATVILGIVAIYFKARLDHVKKLLKDFVLAIDDEKVTEEEFKQIKQDVIELIEG